MTQHLTSTFPIDGELINHARALECGPDFSRIEVRGKTLPGRTVRVNGVPAHSEEDASFRAEAELRGRFPELLLEDGEVLEALNQDVTFFSAAAQLRVPMEMLDFKFRLLKWKGYKMLESPIQVNSNFMRNMEVPDDADYYS